MPRVGFEPTISVFDRAKTVHASDRAVAVIGIQEDQESEICSTYRTNEKYVRNFGGCSSRKILFGTHRRRKENTSNVALDLKETGCKNVEWTQLVQNGVQ
jgi:hypothetical protein